MEYYHNTAILQMYIMLLPFQCVLGNDWRLPDSQTVCFIRVTLFIALNSTVYIFIYIYGFQGVTLMYNCSFRLLAAVTAGVGEQTVCGQMMALQSARKNNK